MRSLIIALGFGTALLAGIAIGQKQPGPVIRQLGPVVPTPEPSPKREQHIRLISSFTLGNKPDGETVIAFEATDFGVSGKGDETIYRTIATEQYTLVEPKPAARALRDQIMRQIRQLEEDLQRFVEITGPPRVRESIQQGGGAAGSTRP
jgi:hypothetical protein